MYTLPNTYKSFPTQSMSCESSELLGVYLFILLQFKRGGGNFSRIHESTKHERNYFQELMNKPEAWIHG